ncbi:MAG: SIR2 family NAD-dependent protein deacylase [Bacteroidia bacterium]
MSQGPLAVVLTGAGVSAESGLSTFRDSGGLWEKYSIYEVATPQAWQKNPGLVLDFYNARRAQLATVKPNLAHELIKKLEEKYTVVVITQNVDDLHERAYSKYILHLHGELIKARSSVRQDLIYEIGYQPICLGDTCEAGYQLRPHVVWFGEAVPAYPLAQEISSRAEVFIVVGTSLQVYPAAGLIDEVPPQAKKFLIDPRPTHFDDDVKVLDLVATKGMEALLDLLGF